jgi:hypothetical protein
MDNDSVDYLKSGLLGTLSDLGEQNVVKQYYLLEPARKLFRINIFLGF